MGVFDHTARRAAKRESEGFFRWLLPRLDPALRFAGWLDTRTAPPPPESELTCDVLAEFVTKDRSEQPWVLVIEFQTEPRGEDLERILEYIVRFRRERRPTWDPRLKYLVGGALLALLSTASLVYAFSRSIASRLAMLMVNVLRLAAIVVRRRALSSSR